MGTNIEYALCILMIILCGYLIISNIFYISISKDIRYYGLLKSLGSTEKQIKKIVILQAFRLCIVGVPLGVILGFLLGIRLTPLFMGMLSTNIISISINPMIFVGGAVFAIITVLISISKFSKLAGKVSPIEALRNTEANKSTKNITKKNGRVNLYKMAQTNAFRNKKKTILVTISLSLSLIILNSTYSIVSSLDMDKYISGCINSDFVVADAGYSNVQIGFHGEDTLSELVINHIKSQEGIEAIGNVYFEQINIQINENMKKAYNISKERSYIEPSHIEDAEQVLEQGMSTGYIYGMDNIILDKMNIKEGIIDVEKLKTGDFVIVNTYDNMGYVNFYEVGEKVTLDFNNGNKKEYEVIAIADVPYNISVDVVWI